jgi:hypothetical protein
MSKEQISKEIQELEAKLVAAKQKLNNFNRLTTQQKIAIMLHDNTCHSNHTDVCGWCYEVNGEGNHDFNGGAHRYYLQKTENILEDLKEIHNLTDYDILRIIDIVTKY